MNISEQNPRKNVDIFRKMDLVRGDRVTWTVESGGATTTEMVEIDVDDWDGNLRLYGVCK